MKFYSKTSLILLALVVFWPMSVLATSDFSLAVWVPYWKKTVAIQETSDHLKQIKTISPFSYEVRLNGTIYDPLKLKQESWVNLLKQARTQGVKVVPSILWYGNNQATKRAIHQGLYNVKKRQAHIASIMALVKSNNFDGIDIDYEGKMAETMPYFSKFLTELSAKLHAEKKILICTIEPRTPDASRFDKIPDDIRFANDYVVLAKVCDEVRLMAYDQTTIDLRLNERKSRDGYYAPVADAEWVAKIINIALNKIPANKIVLGVANYGYVYEVTEKNGSYTYKKLKALTYQTMLDLARDYQATPTRNKAGELGFTYLKDGKWRVVSFSDPVAIAQKVTMAKKYGLKGVALFKVDGESSPDLWSVLR
ncbi:MAG: Glycoside hydrolase family 18 [Parcubacteria group bacterium GW2011_GWC1_43_11b]|uniref:GH18 domain-containing protein n=1 Tax=Candidatus Vogelbacteria bacterium RIFOXYD1_FULL_42_15 TaxID=1802437 RepID=A0A1G2QH85_9BACT|nr:MAG: Glycoside hydrolase family 18 [Parcubacteria group bacterium GW2011_GWB1_42_9]KKS89264.1 MAG: Glycoside hydrolase family 18 [Parcubacteria group bacterium GW2011_GWC1_43_11b]KKT10118.1 MAG: Glycoside hydrolase family 18 [Parcubacteria group bacterium GW2011_GWA1_43_21]OHA59994.1 MAG: hypothetical protein A2607_01775 [Candidatus Vogelbacteria bacterium RIFOXYD1_FULL_42_15]